MLYRKALLLCLLLMVIAFPVLSRESEFLASDTDSVKKVMSEDETILFNMINDMRRQGKMPLIPLSPDLCKVAHVHIADLIASRPQDNGCSLHSWSASGKWTACCHSKDPAGIKCMKSKPKEIVGYPGDGYELIYWGDENATPFDAAAMWHQVDASADMILCRGKWKDYKWKALGVGLKNGYAILWLGDKADKKADIIATDALPNPNQPIEKENVAANQSAVNKNQVKTKTVTPAKEVSIKSEIHESVPSGTVTKFYLIAASLKTAESAELELKRIKKNGYPDAIILEEEKVYRIALISFDDNKKASRKANELKKDFPGIWIYKK